MSTTKTSELETKTQNEPSAVQVVLREILGSSLTRTFLAILAGFVVGGILMAITDEKFLDSIGYFFQRPGDALGAGWQAISNGYTALFQGSIYNPKANNLAGAFKPFTETLRFSGPLILAGLGIALSFRVGLFNIGGLGQMLAAVAGASWVAFAVPLPSGIHMVVAMIVGMLAAALWGSVAGFLKAATGAHEVIVTIMMNYIALNLVIFLMRSGFLHDEAAGSNPKTPAPLETAQYPAILGSSYKLHLGFIVALVGVVFYWWLMERSALGFRLRAVGENPHAAATAGMNVPRLYVITMAASAAFVGFA
ncbi:MAG TPA: ABC transporter permease, partial [Microbacteriaceae bacterium]|nr:ABC transporter permease [Microbacteriaceae bacterium]